MESTLVDFLYRTKIIKENYAKTQVKSNREEILQSSLFNIYFVIQPIINRQWRSKMKPFIEAAKYFPSQISLSNYTYAALFCIVERNDEQYPILIEYGGYDERREGDYEGQVHYFEGNDGLRFVKLTRNDILKVTNQSNQLIPCNLQYKMEVRELLFDTQFCGNLRYWDKNHFSLSNQNCQLFVQKAVKITGCTRQLDYQKDIGYSRMFIPIRILNALVHNEKMFVENGEKRSFEDHKKLIFGEYYIPYNFYRSDQI